MSTQRQSQQDCHDPPSQVSGKYRGPLLIVSTLTPPQVPDDHFHLVKPKIKHKIEAAHDGNADTCYLLFSFSYTKH
jgi:hypothetical protein